MLRHVASFVPLKNDFNALAFFFLFPRSFFCFCLTLFFYSCCFTFTNSGLDWTVVKIGASTSANLFAICSACTRPGFGCSSSSPRPLPLGGPCRPLTPPKRCTACRTAWRAGAGRLTWGGWGWAWVDRCCDDDDCRYCYCCCWSCSSRSRMR